MPQPIIHPRRLLLVRNDRVGDLIVTIPAIEAIRQLWPKVELTVLAGRVAAPLLQDYPAIDNVWVDDPQQSTWQLSRRLRQGAFDTAIVAHTTWRNLLAVRLAGITNRVGWGRKLPGKLLANYRLNISRSRPPVHEADFALRLVGMLQPTKMAAEYPVRLQIDTATQTFVRARIEQQLGTAGPLFAINPSHFRGAYSWPAEQFAQLAAELTQFGRVLVTMGPMETAFAEKFRALLPATAKPRVAVITDFDLRQLAAAFQQTDVITSGNTGPMHLAGALNRPLVALFSAHPAQGPAKWRPLGSRQTLLQAPLLAGEVAEISAEHADEHMSRITVAEVVTANLQWLRQSGRAAA